MSRWVTQQGEICAVDGIAWSAASKVGGIVSGDELKMAIAALRPRLKRFAYGLTGSHHDADDLVQATLERALSRAHLWRAESRLDSWVFRIAQNIRINSWKAAKVRGEHLPGGDPELQSGGDLAREVEARLTLDRVRRFIWALPEEQRVTVLLIVVEGLSYREAADVLDIPIGTLTSRLARARIAIRDFAEGKSETPIASARRSERA